MKLGDKVIYVPKYNGHYPALHTVTRVTPKGMIELLELPKILFKPQHWNDEVYEPWRDGSGRVYVYSKEKMDELNKYAREHERESNKREAEREKNKQERLKRLANELAEVQRVCGKLEDVIEFTKRTSGGNIFVLSIPVKAALLERKGESETIIVKTRVNEQHYNYEIKEYEKGWEFWMTYTHKGTHSFSSSSSSIAGTEDEALWEAIRHAYNNNW